MVGKDNQTKQKTSFKPVTKAVTPKEPEVIPEPKQETVNPDLKIDAVYRRRIIRNGKTTEAISWITADGKHNGLRTEIFKNDDGVVVRRENDFYVDYTDALAKEIMRVAENTNPECRFYFKIGGATYAVLEIENFTGNFKELCQKAMRKEII